jgi:hypothetical protein
MNTWTVTSSGRHGLRTIIGTSQNPEHAREQLFAAAAAMIRRASVDERPRYTLHLGDQFAAIIQTGDDERGQPDHPATADLLTTMQHTQNPYST